MPERAEEDPALAVAGLPDLRHHRAFDPLRMLAGEGRGGEHLHPRVDVQVVLLRPVGEARRDPRHHRIVGPGHVDMVVDDVPRMRHPLAADHELVLRLVAEGVGHAAVIAAEPDPALHRREQVRQLLLADRRHGQDRHDQAEAAEIRVGEGRGPGQE